MKIASGSATWNPEATSHTLAVLSLPAGLRSTRVPRTVGAPSQTLLWGLAVGGGRQGEERAWQVADWMHENIPGALAGRTRNLGASVAGQTGPVSKTLCPGLHGLWHINWHPRCNCCPEDLATWVVPRYLGMSTQQHVPSFCQQEASRTRKKKTDTAISRSQNTAQKIPSLQLAPTGTNVDSGFEILSAPRPVFCT